MYFKCNLFRFFVDKCINFMKAMTLSTLYMLLDLSSKILKSVRLAVDLRYKNTWERRTSLKEVMTALLPNDQKQMWLSRVLGYGHYKRFVRIVWHVKEHSLFNGHELWVPNRGQNCLNPFNVNNQTTKEVLFLKETVRMINKFRFVIILGEFL